MNTHSCSRHKCICYDGLLFFFFFCSLLVKLVGLIYIYISMSKPQWNHAWIKEKFMFPAIFSAFHSNQKQAIKRKIVSHSPMKLHISVLYYTCTTQTYDFCCCVFHSIIYFVLNARVCVIHIHILDSTLTV